VRAALDPVTLAAAVSALVFAAEDFDAKASRWATKHNPIFGSEEGARDASDDLRGALQVEVLATVLLAPSGDGPLDWAWAKARGLGVELLAWGATDAATNFLKDETNRIRPDGTGDRSFPSKHSSDAFAAATLSNRNLDAVLLPRALRPALQAGNLALAGGVAWARVEGQEHFPSDVLAGAALGRFLSAFIHDALMGIPGDGEVNFFIAPQRGSFLVELVWDF
jgi:hypothetical protein